jgi:hypothetical protein
MSLNYPYFIYPGYPFCGYFDTPTYNSNIIKALDLIKDIQKNLNTKILFHLTIGACMEEYINISEQEKDLLYFQWEQLFPYHLREYAKSGGKIINIVLSPTPTLNVLNSISPMFISATNEFDWEILQEQNCIKSRNYDVSIYVFCTMMPTLKYNNIKFERISKLDAQFGSKYVEIIRRNDNDREFTINFYTTLKQFKQTVERYGGAFTCFSFAVFEICTEKAEYFNNYAMFREITSLFRNSLENSLLAEWIFIKTSYAMLTYPDNDQITYTNFSSKEIAKIVVSNENDNLKIKKQTMNCKV